ncbi:MAG: type VI secretion system baseplate subunit TssE [Proteobacteria bacterium]|nr:MAG: type VI secretion system baseplate subunit TssE [Pseudomonadota bacterium]PIE91264.1 MAG: type VI secretion system baseplate subunit TssE [Acidobacteriota bacterium]
MTGFLQKITGKDFDVLGQEDSIERLVESIQSHMVLLLNTRQGMTFHLDKYGLPDIHSVYHELPKSLDQLGDQIKETLEIYEPRLHNIKVKLKNKPEDTFRATFHITGIVKKGSEASKIIFRTDVLNDGSSETKVVDRYE